MWWRKRTGKTDDCNNNNRFLLLLPLTRSVFFPPTVVFAWTALLRSFGVFSSPMISFFSFLFVPPLFSVNGMFLVSARGVNWLKRPPSAAAPERQRSGGRAGNHVAGCFRIRTFTNLTLYENGQCSKIGLKVNDAPPLNSSCDILSKRMAMVACGGDRATDCPAFRSRSPPDVAHQVDVLHVS